jgi:hypothetical protein
MPRYVLIGLCEPISDGDQAVFDEWFIDQHIEDTSQCPGFIKGSVYQLSGPHLDGETVSEYLSVYEVEAESKTAEVNAKRAEEVQGMQANINAYRQGAMEDLQKKQEDLIAPILEKARTAIQKVGRSQGYQYVLDSSSLLLAEGKDLLVDVKKELGI